MKAFGVCDDSLKQSEDVEMEIENRWLLRN